MKFDQQNQIDFGKTTWRAKRSHLYQFYCPLCKVERRVPFRHRPGGIHYVQVGMTAIAFAFATSPWWDWKGIVSFFPFWIVFEVVYRMRMRGALICDSCGFDPTLFLVDQKRARTQVERYWAEKMSEVGREYPSGRKVPKPAAQESTEKSPTA